ncbi:hypothetical protein GCM10023334_077700 [Nonomuraea thailandensis]
MQVVRGGGAVQAHADQDVQAVEEGEISGVQLHAVGLRMKGYPYIGADLTAYGIHQVFDQPGAREQRLSAVEHHLGGGEAMVVEVLGDPGGGLAGDGR